MSRDTSRMALGTFLTRDYPWGWNVAGAALCADGKVRKLKRIAATADSFYSTPASVTVRGRTVAGYVTIETISGLSTATPADPAVLRFVAYTYRKNHGAIVAKVTP